MDRGQFENESLEIKNILNKFNHIGFLDYKEVKKALLINETITNKLDYLKEIKENYFDKYLTVFLSLNEKEQRFQSEILKSIFGNYELWSSLQIQEPIYDEFFRYLENQDTEYQYWFMRFSAEEKFKAKLNSEDYKDMIASSRSEKYIKAELKEINDTIEEVDTLKHRTVRDNKKGDDFIFDWEKSAEDQVSKWCFTDKETELIQIARILDLSYYKENIAKSNIDNLQAEIYFKYILYKEHLEKLLGIKRNIINSNGSKKTINKLSELIGHELSEKIISDIKIKYKNIKGKRLKLLLLSLKELELLPQERIAKKFHDFCDSEFNWDIASYTAMNGYSYNPKVDKVVKLKMISFLNKIISNNK